MEYTIGSVADLISGKSTPNKPKVIKKEFPKPNIDDCKVEAPEGSFVAQTSPVKVSKLDNYKDKLFNKDNEAPFKKGKKKNKKKDKNSENQTDLTVIDHKVIDDIEKSLKNARNTKLEENSNSENEDDEPAGKRKSKKLKRQNNEEDEALNLKSENNDVNEDIDEEETPSWQSPEVKKELNSRTIFVGNVGITVTKSQLLKLFRGFGKVETVRLRCATPANPGMSKRVAVITKLLHAKRATLHSYIRFVNREDALKATELNGTKYKEHHLRVQICDDLEKPNASKAVFIGNLPFDVEDDDLWDAFESFGIIKSVRVVRNAATGMGIGIGYVNFDSPDSVEFALEMDQVTVKNQVVRVKRCNDRQKMKTKMFDQRRGPTNRSSSWKNSRPSYQGTKPSNRPADSGNNKLGHTQPKAPWNRTGGQENPRARHDGNRGPWNKTGRHENPRPRYMEKKGPWDRPNTQSKGQGGAGGQEKPKGLKNKFKDNPSSIKVKNSVFQGSKSDKKKKRPKVNKGFVQKMKLSEKIAPKSMKLQ